MAYTKVVWFCWSNPHIFFSFFLSFCSRIPEALLLCWRIVSHLQTFQPQGCLKVMIFCAEGTLYFCLLNCVIDSVELRCILMVGFLQKFLGRCVAHRLLPLWYCSSEKKQQSIDNCEISDSFNIRLYKCAITVWEMVNFSIGTKPKSNIIKIVWSLPFLRECKTYVSVLDNESKISSWSLKCHTTGIGGKVCTIFHCKSLGTSK